MLSYFAGYCCWYYSPPSYCVYIYFGPFVWPTLGIYLAQGFHEVLQLLIEKLWSSANCFFPKGEGTYDTVLSREIMVAIPLSTGQYGLACCKL